MRYACLFDAEERPVLPRWATVDSDESMLYRRAAARVSLDAGIESWDPPATAWGSLVVLSIDEEVGVDTNVRELASALGTAVVCRVDTKVVLDGVIPATYVKSVGFLRRSTSMTRDEFDAHWNGTHIGLAMAHEHSFFRYTTNVVRDVWGDFEWDGIVEQWFPSEEVLLAEFAAFDPIGQAAVVADAMRLVSEMEHFVAVPRQVSL